MCIVNLSYTTCGDSDKCMYMYIFILIYYFQYSLYKILNIVLYAIQMDIICLSVAYAIAYICFSAFLLSLHPHVSPFNNPLGLTHFPTCPAYALILFSDVL